ncbi:IgGFc-binding protein [Nannocystaceae bacterium ST9]
MTRLSLSSLVLLTLPLACFDPSDEGGDEVAATDTATSTTDESGESESGSDSESSESESTTETGTDSSGSSDSTETSVQVCEPGSTLCVDAQNVQTCLMDGSGYGEPTPCDASEVCSDDQCTSECSLAEANPSSVGCSFFATKMDNFTSNVNTPAQNDSLTAGNISTDKPVTAQLYFVPIDGNAEQPVGAAVEIPPQGTHSWVLDIPEIDSLTVLRVGGVYRLETNLPVVAYQHSPLQATATNDSSMLLPEHALSGNYIIASYQGTVGPYPSYFTAIAVENNTLVNIQVRQATAAGAGVPALAANASTDVMMNRYSVLNMVVAQQQGGDLSGTIITSPRPLHVLGANECANVPNGSVLFCDHIEEAMLPIEYWGEEYVGAHAPARSGTEKYHWRVYAGEDGVTINTSPAQPGFPVNLNKGQFHQFQTTQSFVFTGTGPFMPVQYLEGESGGAGTGDPAMILSVPTEQFLDRYAFVTGTGYTNHYAQVIRPNGGAEVFIDGNMVGGYAVVGNYQVADVAITEGAHFATSDQTFGIIQVGYTGVTSYGYPGGMRLAIINPG